MADVDYHGTPCVANSLLNLETFVQVYAIQAILIVSYEMIQSFLSRRGYALKLRSESFF